MNKKKKIRIEWSRLIEDKGTCPRCGSTEEEIEKAVNKLTKLGYKINLIKHEITLKDFKKDPGRSNEIRINGKPMEFWVSARTASSSCCGVCGDSECRTVEVNDKSYETIPSELIIEASINSMAKIKGLILCVFGGTCPSCKEMDVFKVLDAMRRENLVDFVDFHPQICTEDGNQYLKDLLNNTNIDKLYVAGCDPLTQKKMFRKTFKAAGFDKSKHIAFDVRNLTTEQAVTGIKELIKNNP